MRKDKLEFDENTHEIKIIQKRNLKEVLHNNKIYFETVVMFFLSLMSIVVTIASVVISYNEFKLAKIQTDIVISQNEPNIVYDGFTNNSDENSTEYCFRNIGGISKNLTAHMTDEIVLHIFQDNYMYVVIINVNGRFIQSRDISQDGIQTLLVKANNDIFNPQKFVDEIDSKVGSLYNNEFNYAINHRLIISYENVSGDLQTLKYTILQEKLIKDGSYENAYYAHRDNEITYNIFFDNKDEILETIQKRVESILQ